MTLEGNWNYPTAVRFGAGRAAEIGEAAKQTGLANPLIVTDPGLAELPMIAAALAQVHGAGLGCGVFSDIKSNPTGANIDKGVAAYRAGGHDGVIAFGGGSALDAAKAVALLAGQNRPLWDFEDVGDNWKRVGAGSIAPVLALPTTAGTGSEVGRASVITDEAAEIKRIIFHPDMLPCLVICDPELTVGLPQALTAATGMDALSHAMEALCAPGFHPLARGIALEAIRLIRDALPRVIVDGSDLEARSHMLAASLMGATAFQRGLGAMHALAHPLGALYDAHHGLLNAVLMPYVLEANKPAIGRALTDLARLLALDKPGPDSVLAWVRRMRADIGIPDSLREIGIDETQAVRVGQMAAVDPSAATNPIAFDADDYAVLFKRAVAGG